MSEELPNEARYLKRGSVYAHGLNCDDHDHHHVVSINFVSAARWAIKGLDLELDRAPQPEACINGSNGSSSQSSASSNALPFDLQATADLASSLTHLFRKRRVRTDSVEGEEKGKGVSLYELGIRVAQRVLAHDAVRLASSTTPDALSEKLRRTVSINMLYLLALTETAADGDKPHDEARWTKITKVAETGPASDRNAEDLVAKARRHLVLLQTQQFPLQLPPSTSFQSPRRHSPPRRQTSKFEVGGFDSPPSTPIKDDARDYLSAASVAPPSPVRSTKSTASRSRTTSSPRLRALSRLYPISRSVRASSEPTVAIETGLSAVLLPQSLRKRAISVVTLHALSASSILGLDMPKLRRDKSSASLPDAGSRRRPRSGSRFRPRQWVDELAQTDAVASLKDALRRDDELTQAAIDDASSEDDDADEAPTTQPIVKRSVPRMSKTPTASSSMVKGVDPRLASLEDASRVNVVTSCAVCERKGVNVRSSADVLNPQCL